MQNTSINENTTLFNGNLLSPPVVVEEIFSNDQRFYVIRDDLLPGGTKQRACSPFIKSLAEKGFNTFYYASPFAGFAQVALAYTCSQLGVKCRIYCERDPTQKIELAKHEFTALAESFGAEITIVHSLGEAEILANHEARKSDRNIRIPLGFNCTEFKQAFEKELRIQWGHVKQYVGKTPNRIWLPVGSGTLTTVFDQVLDPQTKISAVNIRVLSGSDPRILTLQQNARLSLFTAPETFNRKAQHQPPIPSNNHYDAKLWQFLFRYGDKDDIWWNVAR